MQHSHQNVASVTIGPRRGCVNCFKLWPRLHFDTPNRIWSRLKPWPAAPPHRMPTRQPARSCPRWAQSTALVEDYAELIADLLASEGEARPTDIARRLGVSHATAIKSISRLKRAGLATARPYRGVFLTDKGRALADRVRVRHRLVVDVLQALGVPSEAAEADAEGIEHHVSETTLKAFAQFLKARD